jgi:hypothetical protein
LSSCQHSNAHQATQHEFNLFIQVQLLIIEIEISTA